MNRRSILILAAALLGLAALPGFAADNYIITTVVGTGKPGFSGDGGPATQAMIDWRDGFDLWATDSGVLYIADSRNNRIRKVDEAGIITTVAGNGTRGFSGDGGPATEASFHAPYTVRVDRHGNIYIVDAGNNRLRKVDRYGIVTTIAGNGWEGDTGDGGLATAAACAIGNIAFDPAGNIYLGVSIWNGERIVSSRIRRIDTSGTITAFAGTGAIGNGGDGGPAINATFTWVADLCFDLEGNLYVTDIEARRLRKIDAKGIITTVAGDGYLDEDGAPAKKSYLNSPGGLSVDSEGNIYLGELNRVRKIDTAGNIATIAGRTRGYSGDGGPAREAAFGWGPCPRVVADGSIFVADQDNNVVRKLTRR